MPVEIGNELSPPLSLPPRPSRDELEAPVVQEIRHRLVDTFQKFECSPGSSLEEIWYFSLLAIDPDFVRSTYQYEFSYLEGHPHKVSVDGLQFLLSTSLSDEQVEKFSRSVLDRVNNASCEYPDETRQQLSLLLATTNHFNVLSTLISEGQLSLRSLCYLVKYFLKNSFDIPDITNLKTINPGPDEKGLDKVIQSMWDSSILLQPERSRRERSIETIQNKIRAVVALSHVGLPTQKLLSRLSIQLNNIEYLITREEDNSLPDEFAKISTHVPLHNSFKISEDEHDQITAQLKDQGIMTASVAGKALFRVFRQLWVLENSFSLFQVESIGMRFTHQYRAFLHLVTSILERVGAGNIESEMIRGAAQSTGISNSPHYSDYYSSAAAILNGCPNEIVDSLESSFEIYDLCGDILPNIDEVKLLEQIDKEKCLSFYLPPLLLTEKLADRFKDPLRMVCQNAASKKNAFFHFASPYNFITLVKRLNIQFSEKRRLVELAVSNQNTDNLSLGTDCPNIDDLKMIKSFVDIYYSPLSEYRGGIKKFYECPGIDSMNQHAFSLLMNDVVLHNYVHPKDEGVFIQHLVDLFVGSVSVSYSQGRIEPSMSGPLPYSPSLLNGLGRINQKSVHPIQSVPNTSEVVGKLSRPLFGTECYLLSSICNSYYRNKTEYIPLGEHTSNYGLDDRISGLLSQVTEYDTDRKKLVITLLCPENRMVLPVPPTTFQREIELVDPTLNLKFDFDKDHIPFIKRGVPRGSQELSYLLHCSSLSPSIVGMTVQGYRQQFSRRIIEASTKNGVRRGDLSTPILAWIDSLQEQDLLEERIEELLKIVGRNYLYNLMIGHDPRYNEVLNKDRGKNVQRDPFLKAIHATGNSQYLGETVCGGVSHIVVQALRHAGIPVLLGSGYRVPEGAQTFSSIHRHAFPLLLVQGQGGVALYPIESTKYMQVTPESAELLKKLKNDRIPEPVEVIAVEAMENHEILAPLRSGYTAIVANLSAKELKNLNNRLSRILTSKGRVRDRDRNLDLGSEFSSLAEQLFSVEGLATLLQIGKHRSLSTAQREAISSLRFLVEGSFQEFLENLKH